MSTFENASHTVSRFSQVTALSQLSSAGRSTTPLQGFIVLNIDSFRTAQRLVCLRRSWDTQRTRGVAAVLMLRAFMRSTNRHLPLPLPSNIN